jgi:translation initiation factor IF-1
MGWASGYIEKLKKGETVSFRPRGNSMSPRIKSGQLCTVRPVNSSELQEGNIILCKIRGTEYLHLVRARQGDRFQIMNNHGKINGWIGASSIFGLLIKIEK